jgi:hypothetical protein
LGGGPRDEAERRDDRSRRRRHGERHAALGFCEPNSSSPEQIVADFVVLWSIPCIHAVSARQCKVELGHGAKSYFQPYTCSGALLPLYFDFDSNNQ